LNKPRKRPKTDEGKWEVDNKPWIKPVKEFDLKNRKPLFTPQGTINLDGRKTFTSLQQELGLILEKYLDDFKPQEVDCIVRAVSGLITATYAATLFHLCNHKSKAHEQGE